MKKDVDDTGLGYVLDNVVNRLSDVSAELHRLRKIESKLLERLEDIKSTIKDCNRTAALASVQVSTAKLLEQQAIKLKESANTFALILGIPLPY